MKRDPRSLKLLSITNHEMSLLLGDFVDSPTNKQRVFPSPISSSIYTISFRVVEKFNMG